MTITKGTAEPPHDWGTLHWLASDAVGNATGVTLGRVLINAGDANPRHVHDNCEEVLYLLAGRLRHSIGEKIVELEPGDVLVVGPGIVHHAEAIGDEPADMIVAYSSAQRAFRAADEG